MITWEPVPRFRAFLEWSVAANRLNHLVTVRPHVASDAPRGTVRMATVCKVVYGREYRRGNQTSNAQTSEASVGVGALHALQVFKLSVPADINWGAASVNGQNSDLSSRESRLPLTPRMLVDQDTTYHGAEYIRC